MTIFDYASFGNWLRGKGKRDSTFKNYAYALSRIEHLFSAPIQNYSPDEINSIIFKKSGLPASVLYMATAALKKYLQFTGNKKSGLEIEKPDGYKSNPRKIFLLPNQIDALLKANSGEIYPELALKTLIYTGIRRGLLANMRVIDIDTTSRTIKIDKGTVGNKAGIEFKTIMFGDDLHALFSSAIEKYALKSDDYLLKPLYEPFKPTSEKVIKLLKQNYFKIKVREGFVSEYVERLGMKANMHVTPHMLRHTFATYYYYRFKDIIGLRDYLGQVTIEATQRYIHSARELEEYLEKDKEKWSDYMEKMLNEFANEKK